MGQQRRTTWWKGYWINSINGSTSTSLPQKNQNGIYIGNGDSNQGIWRQGGAPSRPTTLQWLLSIKGGNSHY